MDKTGLGQVFIISSNIINILFLEYCVYITYLLKAELGQVRFVGFLIGKSISQITLKKFWGLPEPTSIKPLYLSLFLFWILVSFLHSPSQISFLGHLMQLTLWSLPSSYWIRIQSFWPLGGSDMCLSENVHDMHCRCDLNKKCGGLGIGSES